MDNNVTVQLGWNRPPPAANVDNHTITVTPQGCLDPFSVTTSSYSVNVTLEYNIIVVIAENCVGENSFIIQLAVKIGKCLHSRN